MNTFTLQKQLKKNANDLEQFYKELKSWGEDMKRKEASHKQNVDPNVCASGKQRKRESEKKKTNDLKVESTRKSKNKIGYTDYSAWDKFDADAECEKVDHNDNDDSELSDEFDETKRDQAYVEKEKGNNFVKSGNWDAAIECYTKAIDCYAYDPVFYANRALCFLKKEDMTKAETDCTMSLKLDKTYVKAYLRRAAAREALNKQEEAEDDLLRVLELEPKNKETRNKLDNLRNKMKNKMEKVQRPISKFTASRQQKKTMYNTAQSIQDMKSIQSCEDWPDEIDNIISVKAVNKPVHLRSKKPLKRISISEIREFKEENKPDRKQADAVPRELQKTIRTDDLKVVERFNNQTSGTHEILKETKNQVNSNKMRDQMELFQPKNSVQFYSHWKYLGTLEEKYGYLKLIDSDQLPHIFKESLDSQVFCEILEVLAKCFISHNDQIFKFLLSLSKIKRFSAFTMFMTDNDKYYLLKLFDHIKEHEDHPVADVDILFKKYEL